MSFTITKSLLALLAILLSSLLLWLQVLRHEAEPTAHEQRVPVATISPDDTINTMQQGWTLDPPIPQKPDTAPATKPVPRHQRRGPAVVLSPDDTIREMHRGYLPGH